MAYYKKHLFFCVNERDCGRQCCYAAGSASMREYAKRRIKAKGLAGPGGVRVNKSGCLDRCAEGPVLVVYPEGVWYTYECQTDIDEIIESHIINDQIVERLLLPE